MGSGSLEPAFASLVPTIMSMRASITDDAATLVCLNITTPRTILRLLPFSPRQLIDAIAPRYRTRAVTRARRDDGLTDSSLRSWCTRLGWWESGRLRRSPLRWRGG